MTNQNDWAARKVREIWRMSLCTQDLPADVAAVLR